mmetsp:Transcript_12510/g.56386  ORF Transcript_12510/g.56386 Transcript_12510/m.56386 type:complete len:214 (+) Transcript_12510:263-904(+)
MFGFKVRELVVHLHRRLEVVLGHQRLVRRVLPFDDVRSLQRLHHHRRDEPLPRAKRGVVVEGRADVSRGEARDVDVRGVVGDLANRQLAKVLDPLPPADLAPTLRRLSIRRFIRRRALSVRLVIVVVRILGLRAVLRARQTKRVRPLRAPPRRRGDAPRPTLGVGRALRVGVHVRLRQRRASKLRGVGGCANLVPPSEPGGNHERIRGVKTRR